MNNLTYVRLSQSAKKSWFVSRFIFLLVLTIIIIALSIVFDYNKWIIIIGGVLILLQGLNAFLYPIIEFKQWKYMMNDERIEFVEGIFFLTTTIIPIVRIQNLKINEGPINRFLNLANIEIFTAGGTFSIPNLDKDVADEICMYLRNTINERVNEQKENKDDRKES